MAASTSPSKPSRTRALAGSVRKKQPAATTGRAVKTSKTSTGRVQSAQATRDSILNAATRVFAKYGYAGGSVDKISSLAKSYDRMIYYYFGSKEGLFIEVLENMYRRMNEAEEKLALDTSQPLAALEAVIAFVIGYYRKNPEFVTLLNTENLLKGRHIAKSLRAREYSSPAISVIGQILQSGVSQQVFRPGLQARDVYLMIAAMGYFYMSNRHTLSAFLGENLEAPAALADWQAFATQAVLRMVCEQPPA